MNRRICGMRKLLLIADRVVIRLLYFLLDTGGWGLGETGYGKREGGIRMNEMIPIESIENRIFIIRGQKIMLDFHLAGLYGVETRQLKRQVRRNIKRFPEDFMFELNRKEYAILRCQFGTLNWGEHTKYLPFAFTEQGIAMLSSVLRSERAIQVNILIMRAFVRFKHFLETHKELKSKLDLLEDKFGKHLKRHDEDIQLIFEAIRKMLVVEETPRKRIGFVVRDEGRGKRAEGNGIWETGKGGK